MKDVRIVEALDDIDADDLARQRMLAALLAERERMRTTGDAAPAAGKPDTDDATSKEIHRGRRGAALKIVFGIAACLLIVLGIGSVAMPRMTGVYSSSSSSVSEGISADETDSVQSSSSESESAQTGSATASQGVSAMSAAPDAGAIAEASFSLGGSDYHASSSEQAASLGLTSPLQQAALADPLGTVEVTLGDGSALTASVTAIKGVSRGQAVAVQLEGSTDWIPFIAS